MVFLVVLLRHACTQEEDTDAGSANNLRIKQAIGKNWGSVTMEPFLTNTPEYLGHLQINLHLYCTLETPEYQTPVVSVPRDTLI